MIDTATASARARSRRLATVSTPVGLTVTMVVTLCAVILFGVVATRATLERQSAADDVVAEAAPLLLDAQALYGELADADAVATTIYLRAGTESPQLRRRYLDDVEQAMNHLAVIAGADLGRDARGAAATIATRLPAYTGLVEAARANSRQRFPVGAAYQRRASELMRDEILPASTAIYEDAVVGLDGRLANGSGTSGPTGLAIAAAATLVLLVLAQLYVTSRSRRWLNAGLLAAVVALVAGSVAGLAGLRHQRDALAETRDEGFAFVTSLATARILTLRSASDENLDLIERGTDPQYIEDFDARFASLGVGADVGLLDVALAATPDGVEVGAVRSLQHLYGEYVDVHDDVRADAERRDYPEAIDVAVDRQADTVAELDTALADLIDRSAVSLRDEAERARDLPVPLPLVVAAFALVAAVAIVVGLQPRLREYR